MNATAVTICLAAVGAVLACAGCSEESQIELPRRAWGCATYAVTTSPLVPSCVAYVDLRWAQEQADRAAEMAQLAAQAAARAKP
jgi:hypothetical protein